MLGGAISNQDEDEVEEELANLEAELRLAQPLPNVPKISPPVLVEDRPDPQPAKLKQKEPERQAVLA